MALTADEAFINKATWMTAQVDKKWFSCSVFRAQSAKNLNSLTNANGFDVGKSRTGGHDARGAGRAAIL